MMANGQGLNSGDPFDERPTRVRHMVVAVLAAMAFVLYLDRLCISQAAPAIQKELGLSEAQKGWVFGAFTIAYALFEIPSGRWGDRYGSRGVLTRIVLWWSLFTALTGAAWGFLPLLAIRFLFGAGEAGALPNTARVLRHWYPESSRGRAQGTIATAMGIGGAFAPWAAQALINRVGWRWTFAVLALLGVAWALFFYWWFQDDPAEHPGVNAAERDLIAGGDGVGIGSGGGGGADHGPIPWSRVALCANIWLLGLAMNGMAAIYELFSSWYPTYLQSARGVSPDESGRLASLVMGSATFGTFCGGWLTDWLVQKTGSARWGRTAQAMLGAGACGLALFASVQTESVGLASAFIALAAFSMHLQVAPWWTCATRVSGRHVGALFGLMNMAGGLGRFAAEPAVGRFIDWRAGLGYAAPDQWAPVWYSCVGVAVCNVVLWSLINPEKTVDDGPEDGTKADGASPAA